MQTKQDDVESSLRIHRAKVSLYRTHTPDVPPLTTQQLTDTQSGAITPHYRLQQSAYVNRRDIPPSAHHDIQYYPGILHDLTHHTSHLSVNHNNKLMNNTYVFNDKKAFDTSLPRIVITRSDERGFPDSQPIIRIAPAAKHGPGTDRAAKEHSVLGIPPTPSAIVSKEKVQKEKVLPASNSKRNKQNFYDAPNELAMKLSLPCQSGCCYCVYASLLGPVKVFVSRADPPKKGPFLGKIKDGNGRPVIPVARKSDLRGLVYDPKSHSLYPPISKRERPLFQETRGSPKNKVPQGGTKSDVSNRKTVTKRGKSVYHKH